MTQKPKLTFAALQKSRKMGSEPTSEAAQHLFNVLQIARQGRPKPDLRQFLSRCSAASPTIDHAAVRLVITAIRRVRKIRLQRLQGSWAKQLCSLQAVFEKGRTIIFDLRGKSCPKPSQST